MKISERSRGRWIQIGNRLSLFLQLLASIFLYLLIESMCRHSLAAAFSYMVGKPLVFLYNAGLIFVSFTLVYLTRRRIFARVFLSAFWLFLGVINGVLLTQRVTPFTGADLKLITEAFKTLNKYLPAWAASVIIGFIILLLLGLVIIMFKAPVYKGRLLWKLNIPFVLAAFAGMFLMTNIALSNRVLSNYFGNIAFAYQDYGYPYCLGVTLFQTGIDQPNGYSKALMEEIANSTRVKGQTKKTDQPVNIVFVQLESFMDPKKVEFLKISRDPIPNFRKLMKKYSSGYFKVPVVGAGTANTEFETITGMSLHYFGPGEYPFKTILKKSTCESAPFVLKGLGYSTHAIHNNEANFYGRRWVYPNLGFESYTSEEYMPDISDVTYTGWVKDHILTDEIMKCLESSKGPDYVYTVSVQGHGDYPSEPVLENSPFKVTGAGNREKNNYSWQYFCQQLYEMDQFVGDLTQRLSKFKEPTVVVMYGDHLPTMGLKAEDLKNRYLYQTEYVMWDNFGLKKKDKNLATYQMAAEVMNRIGIHEGQLMTYHQSRRKTKNYQVDLEALQYDMLYGERYVYQGQEPFSRVKMKLGVVPITLTSVREISPGSWEVKGNNFTASSKLEVNGELIEDTIFVNTNELLVRDVELQDGARLTVAQQSNSSTHKVLSRTGAIHYEAHTTEEGQNEEGGALGNSQVQGSDGEIASKEGISSQPAESLPGQMEK